MKALWEKLKLIFYILVIVLAVAALIVSVLDSYLNKNKREEALRQEYRNLSPEEREKAEQIRQFYE